MAQQVRTVNGLILDAFSRISELSDNEQPSGLMNHQGINILNDLLDTLSTDEICIPYVQTFTFNLVPGQDIYTMSNVVGTNPDLVNNRIVDISNATYEVNGSLIYPIKPLTRTQYVNRVRLSAAVLQTRPSFVFLDKQATESRIIFYAAPDQAYSVTLYIKVMLDSVIAGQTLTSIAPHFYRFLSYALARELNNWYPSSNWTPKMETEYTYLYKLLKSGNEIDLTIVPSSLLEGRGTYYWQNIYAW